MQSTVRIYGLIVGLATGLFTASLFLCAVSSRGAGMSATHEPFTDGKILEAYGWTLAQERKIAGLEANDAEIKLFTDGFQSGLGNRPAPAELRSIYPEIERVAKARRQKLVEAVKAKNRAAAAAFFQSFQGNTNLVIQSDGNRFEILKTGQGKPPKIGDTVNVHFTGHLIDGTEFYQMGPMDMVLVTNQDVCRGWSDALQKIRPGGALRLYVPPPLVEADAARFGIEPDSAMIFDVELGPVRATPAQELADATMSPAPEPMVPANHTDAEVLQAWGWVTGQETAAAKFGLNQEEQNSLVQGLRAAIKGGPASPDVQAAMPGVANFVAERRARAQAEAERNHRQANQAFFEKLKRNPRVTHLADGLCYEIITPGAGPCPKPDQTVKVLYTGRLIDGRIFDSTQIGPLDIDLDKVCRGWSEGVEKINRGGKIKLYIPPALAYGSEATSGIPPDSILIFEIELLEIKDGTQSGR